MATIIMVSSALAIGFAAGLGVGIWYLAGVFADY